MSGFSNGTTRENVQPGKQMAVHGKVFVTPLQGRAGLALSACKVDHSGNGAVYPGTGTKSYLFANDDRAGSRHDVWNGPFDAQKDRPSTGH